MTPPRRPRKRKGAPAPTHASKTAEAAEESVVVLEKDDDGKGWHRVTGERLDAIEKRIAAIESPPAPPAPGAERF